MELSLIIPCFNEEPVIQETYRRVTDVVKNDSAKNGYSYEIIFIDDGSTDGTLAALKAIESKDGCVRYISFARNFGKESAMFAGLKFAVGDAVVILDADLQHPPELIPEMVGLYLEGYNQVVAKRNRNGDGIIRTAFSRLYYKIANLMMDVNLVDGEGDFRLLSRKAVDAILSMGETNRFSKGMFAWIGFSVKVIEYENQDRAAGRSKWSFRKLTRYAADGMLSFNDKPLRVSLYTGLMLVILAAAYIIYSLIRVFTVGVEAPGYFTLISAVLIIGGVQLISTGVIGEYVGRIYYEAKKRPHFIINEVNMQKAGAVHADGEKYDG